MTESKPRRIRMSANDRRLQLISVGREVFAERGFEASSVEEIAQRAGVTKPIIYEHFRGKEGLFDVIVDREMNDLLARVAVALAWYAPCAYRAGCRLFSPLYRRVARRLSHVAARCALA